jgi:protease-4
MKKEQTFALKLWVSISILVSLLLIGSLIALILGSDTRSVGANTAIIRINGPIMADTAGGLFAELGTSSTAVIELLEEARDDKTITAVILEINSPGGSAVASDEIAQAVQAVAEEKIVVAWIRESGASGAYWIASSADHVVANRMSITGSVGVISSYLEFDEFIDDWNVSYNRLVAGERKDIGDPFTDLTPEREAFMQQKLDRVHRFFIESVAENRNLTQMQVASISTGEFFLGVEAKELGLVDELGGKEAAIAYIEEQTGKEAVTVYFEPEATFFEALFGVEETSRMAGSYRGPLALADIPVPLLR